MATCCRNPTEILSAKGSGATSPDTIHHADAGSVCRITPSETEVTPIAGEYASTFRINMMSRSLTGNPLLYPDIFQRGGAFLFTEGV